MVINKQFLRPSGVNSSFHGASPIFQDYIQHCQNFIAAGRLDLPGSNAFRFIDANSPFEYRPAENFGKPTKGVLCIHGLYDSPFTFREIGQHLQKQGFLVRALLLPGHGTVPGDLLHMHYQEWFKAVAYAVNTLTAEVDEVYLAGFSLGGALAIYQALQDQTKIKGLLLFAPALKPKRATTFLLHGHSFVHWMGESIRWYQRLPQKSHVKYESFPCNAAYQACRVMRITRALISEKILNLPLFVVMSGDDEAVDVSVVLEFFLNELHPQSRLLFYSNDNSINVYKDTRLIGLPSSYPQQRILNFSHICIPISPTNTFYGTNGEFHDFEHYRSLNPKAGQEIHMGAASEQNLKQYALQRLTYNPDFDNMLSKMDQFLTSV